MSEENGLLSRRTVLKSGAGAAAVGAVGAGALFYGSQPALAVEESDIESGDDLYIQQNEDGDVEEISIIPNIDVEWSNLDSEPTDANIDIEVEVTPPDGGVVSDTVVEDDLSLENDGEDPDHSDSDEPLAADLEETYLINQEDEDLDTEFESEHFPTTDDDEYTDVEVTFTLTIDSGADEFVVDELNASDTATFGVDVDEGADASGSGTIDSDGELDQE